MRILVIQTAYIGDVVLTTPFIEALKQKWPQALIHVVATPLGCEILEGLERVHCHPMDKKKAGWFKSVQLAIDAIGPISFDIVFCVHRSLRSLWLGRRIQAQKRVAFQSLWSWLLGYQTVRYPPYDESVHYIDKPLALLKDFGGAVQSVFRPVLGVQPEAMVRGRSLLAPLKATSYAIISPFSVWGTKTWFADRFARVGAEIAKKHGMGFVIIGAPTMKEQVIGETIAEKIKEAGGRSLSLVGKTSLSELKAIVKGASLMIANDSAPVHIAAAFDVPTIAIFGPTVKRWGFFPRSTHYAVVERSHLKCRPCHVHGPMKCPRGHFKCMDEIAPAHVIEALEKLMSGKCEDRE